MKQHAMKSPTSSPTRRGLAAMVAVGLMFPAAVALAKPSSDGSVTERPATENSDDESRHPKTRPAAQVDKVYKGSVEGGLGTYVWSGDLFGTGDTTVVTYEVSLDEAGVPTIAGVAIDESTLPEGAAYELRTSSNRTSDTSEPDEKPAEPVEVVASVDDETTTTVEETTTTTVAETTTTTAEETTTTTGEDTGETPDDDEALVTFAARGGVVFSMGGRWAGLLLLANGRLSGDSAMAIRTVLVSPPVAPVEAPAEEPATPPADDDVERSDGRADDKSDRGDDDRAGDDRGGDDRARDDRTHDDQADDDRDDKSSDHRDNDDDDRSGRDEHDRGSSDDDERRSKAPTDA